MEERRKGPGYVLTTGERVYSAMQAGMQRSWGLYSRLRRGWRGGAEVYQEGYDVYRDNAAARDRDKGFDDYFDEEATLTRTQKLNRGVTDRALRSKSFISSIASSTSQRVLNGATYSYVLVEGMMSKDKDFDLAPYLQKQTTRFTNLLRQMCVSIRMDEQDLIEKEMASIRETIALEDITPQQRRECACELLAFCCLGYDTKWAIPFVLRLCASTRLVEKRTGYVLMMNALREDEESGMLLVNMLQRDIQSSNYIHVGIGLLVIPRIVQREHAMYFIPPLLKLLKHWEPSTRKKSVIALHGLYVIDPDTLTEESLQEVLKALTDSDPGVMTCVVFFMYALMIKGLLGSEILASLASLLGIFKQVIRHKLPSEFMYEGLQAPWLQMRMIRMMSYAGNMNDEAHAQTRLVLLEALKYSARIEFESYMQCALAFEAVKAVCPTYLDREVTLQVKGIITRMMQTGEANMRYMTLRALSLLSQSNREVIGSNKRLVISSLSHTDASIQRQALELLSYVIESSNSQLITAKLLNSITNTLDDATRHRYAQSMLAILNTKLVEAKRHFNILISLFFLVNGELMDDIIRHVVKLMEEGDEELQQHSFYILRGVLSGVYLPYGLLQVVLWFLRPKHRFETMGARSTLTALIRHFWMSDNEYGRIQIMGFMLCWIQGDAIDAETFASVVQPFLKACKTLRSRTCLQVVHEIETTRKMMQENVLSDSILSADISCEPDKIDNALGDFCEKWKDRLPELSALEAPDEPREKLSRLPRHLGRQPRQFLQPAPQLQPSQKVWGDETCDADTNASTERAPDGEEEVSTLVDFTGLEKLTPLVLNDTLVDTPEAVLNVTKHLPDDDATMIVTLKFQGKVYALLNVTMKLEFDASKMLATVDESRATKGTLSEECVKERTTVSLSISRLELDDDVELELSVRPLDKTRVASHVYLNLEYLTVQEHEDVFLLEANTSDEQHYERQRSKCSATLSFGLFEFIRPRPMKLSTFLRERLQMAKEAVRMINTARGGFIMRSLARRMRFFIVECDEQHPPAMLIAAATLTLGDNDDQLCLMFMDNVVTTGVRGASTRLRVILWTSSDEIAQSLQSIMEGKAVTLIMEEHNRRRIGDCMT